MGNDGFVMSDGYRNLVDGALDLLQETSSYCTGLFVAFKDEFRPVPFPAMESFFVEDISWKSEFRTISLRLLAMLCWKFSDQTSHFRVSRF